MNLDSGCYGELCALRLLDKRTATIAASTTTLVQLIDGDTVRATAEGAVGSSYDVEYVIAF